MLGFVVIVAPAVAIAVVALFCLILVLGYVLYLRPLIDWATRRGSGFLGRLIRWVTRPVVNYVNNFISKHIQLLIRSHFTGIAPLVTLLNQLTDLTQRTAGTLADMAEQTWRALWTLNHETIPLKIAAATLPLRQQLTRHTERLDAIEDLNRLTAVVVGSGLRALPWGAPGTYVGNFEQWWNSYRHLWKQTFETLMPRVTELWSERVANLRDRFNELETRVTLIREEALPAIRQRIGRIEDFLGGLANDPTTWVLGALGLAAVPALTAGGMRTALRNLTCRNTQDVTSRLCRMDPADLEALLAGTLVLAFALNPREVARVATATTGALSGLIRESVSLAEAEY